MQSTVWVQANSRLHSGMSVYIYSSYHEDDGAVLVWVVFRVQVVDDEALLFVVKRLPATRPRQVHLLEQ